MRNTFPLDQGEIKKRRLASFAKSNVCLAAGILGVTVLLSPIAALGKVALVIGGAYGLRWVWKLQKDKLEANVLRELIEESNKMQDDALKAAMKELQASGRSNYSVTLGRFLVLKQAIERKIHEDSKITPEKTEIENLVDEISFSVKENIFKIVKIEERTASILVSPNADELIETDNVRRKYLRQIVNAFDTLNDTYINLETLLRPGRFKESPEDPVDSVIEKLRVENELAKTVEERLDFEFPVDDDPVRDRDVLPE
ncbi:MAG: hypothetical protein AAFX93_04760 [Verrucomicrobiota bacterium]